MKKLLCFLAVMLISYMVGCVVIHELDRELSGWSHSQIPE